MDLFRCPIFIYGYSYLYQTLFVATTPFLHQFAMKIYGFLQRFIGLTKSKTFILCGFIKIYKYTWTYINFVCSYLCRQAMRQETFRIVLTKLKLRRYSSAPPPFFFKLGRLPPCNTITPLPNYNTDTSIRQDILNFLLYQILSLFSAFLNCVNIFKIGYYMVTTNSNYLELS